jgi:cobalt-zinc-cadmium efflux system outer membrane protein
MRIKRAIPRASILLAFLYALTASAMAQSAQNEVAINDPRSAPSATANAPVKTGAAVYLNPVDGMSVEEAVRYALAHHKGLLADRKLIDEAQGRLKQAALRANPMLDVSRTSDLGDSSQSEFSIGVSVPLELGGRRARRIEVAERELERMRFEVAERERKVAAEVRMKYGEAVEAARNLELNDRLLELNQQSYGLIKVRVEEGASAPLEQSMLRVEVSRIEAQRIAFDTRVAVLIEELKNLLGMAAEEKLQVRDEFIERPIALSREQMMEIAFKSRPDLQAARATETLAAALIAQAKAEGKADLSVFAEFGRDAVGFHQLGLSPISGQPERIFMKSNMVKAGVSIALPLRNRNQGNIEAAVAASEEARLRREFIETIVRREVAAAYTRYEGAVRVLKTYNTDLLAASQNNLRVVRASYDLGHVRLNEVLNEQRRLVDVQMSYTGALKEYYAARAELESALGAPLEGK